MAFSGIPFFPPSRAVIMMMDDSVVVHRVSNGHVQYVDSVPWRTQSFEDKLSSLLQNMPIASVMIVNDAVEQHYRKERIVIPTSFDKANIIKRRLTVAFPSYPMRAAIELKENQPVSTNKGKEQDKGKPYLFTAAPSSESFSRIVRGIRRTDYNFFGYGLLPVEIRRDD